MRSNNTLDRFSHNDMTRITEARGSWLHDSNGNRYLDFGVTGASILGYGRDDLARILYQQASRVPILSPNECLFTEEREELSHSLCDLSNADSTGVFYSGSSGSSAIECAIKISLLYHHLTGVPQKKGVLFRRGSYHGISSGAYSLSGGPLKYAWGSFQPSNTYEVPNYNPYKDKGLLLNDNADYYLEEVLSETKKTIESVGPENISCFVVESILGLSQGDVIAPKSYWLEINQLCKDHNILLVVDEVYSGCGKSGSFFSHHQDGINADLVCLGKALTAGYAPLSCVMLKNNILKEIEKFGELPFCHTYSNWPPAFSVALEVVNLLKVKYIENVKTLEESIKSELINILPESKIRNIRGRGTMLTVEFNEKSFYDELVHKLRFDHNILFRHRDLRISFSPALTMTPDELDYFFESLNGSLNKTV